MKKNKSNIKTSTFSKIPGFTFEYPDFEGWVIDSTKKEKKKVIVTFKSTGLSSFIYQKLTVQRMPKFNTKFVKHLIEKYNRDLSINPNKVFYEFNYFNSEKDFYEPIPGRWRYLDFYGKDFGTRIEISLGDEGFSKDIFANRIIKTFKFN